VLCYLQLWLDIVLQNVPVLLIDFIAFSWMIKLFYSTILIIVINDRNLLFHSGLVTKLTDDQKYGMIEAIAHLIHRDYPAIVKDFVKLGFIPDGVNLDPILPVLAKVFDQALEGGGAKNINFQELASDLAQITFDYPFRIPPYFALIIRAIGVLEGIALVGNSDFAIVDEAYPYIAQV
jgi:aarF domain-containing kinase